MNDDSESRVQAGDTVDNKYRIVQKLGEGGVGSVFEAENTWTTRRVAIKVLRAGVASDSDAVERFKREAQTATRLAHPNIIDVLDMGRDARTGQLYIVQALLTGGDLRATLEARGRLSTREALNVMVPVMEALSAAHDCGILHRDVKPENIFLDRALGGRVTPKLIDFGISKVLGGDEALRMTRTGVAIGTPCYMSPEQLCGERDVDARIDVWSVGAVLFELLCGRCPFEAGNYNLLIFKIMTEAPPSLDALAPDVAPAVASVIDRALQRDRSRRFATMKAFLDALVAADATGVQRKAPEPVARAPIASAAATAPTIIAPIPITQSVEDSGRPSFERLNIRVLVVDDDDSVRRAITRALSRFNVTGVADGAQALGLLEAPAPFDLVLTDLEMPHVDGIEVVRAAVRADVPVIMITGSGTIDTAVHAMRLGAVNFITKPFTNDALNGAITDVLAARTITRTANDEVVGSDPNFRSVLDLVEVVSDTDATVLLTGETGTGKEVMAKLIHRLSPRRDKPFVAVNVGAIPEAQLEGDLFGHKRGAFAGADGDKLGYVTNAEGGSLFLDEIGDMPLGCQVKILRLVQEHVYNPLGDSKQRRANVHIIAATHRDLAERVREGAFRADLYYRLSVVTLPLPPLRERRGDIPDLVTRFIATANKESRRRVSGIDDDALGALCAYGWPGNVRELHNVVTRMVIFNRSGRIALSDVPREIRGAGRSVQPAPVGVLVTLPPEGVDLEHAREQFEADMIYQALERTDGNQSDASKLLGMTRGTLVDWLSRKGGTDKVG